MQPTRQTLEQLSEVLASTVECLARLERLEAQSGPSNVAGDLGFLSLLLTNAPMVIGVASLDGRILLVNRRWEEVVGRRREDVIGRRLEEVYPAETARQMKEAHQRVIETGAPLEIEQTVGGADGPHEFYTVTFPMRGAGGEIEAVGVVAINITERRRTEEARRASEARLGRWAESKPMGIVLADSTLRIVEANDAFLKMVGYGREDLAAGKLRWDDLIPEEYRDICEQVRKEVEKSGVGGPVQKAYVRKDGSRVPVLLGVTGLKEPKGHRICFVLDLTERKRAEEALEASEARFRSIFEDAAVGISVLDLEGKILAANPTREEMLGYREEELLGRVFTDFVHPEEVARAAARFKELAEGDRDEYEAEKRCIRKDGQVVWWQFSMGLVRDAERRPQFAIACIRDITERKRAQEALRAS